MRDSKKVWSWALSIALTIALFPLLFWLSDTNVEEVWQALYRAGAPALLAVIAVVIAQISLQTWSWMILLRGSGYRVSFFSAFSAMLAGYVGNYVTPSMYLGGEPFRAYVLTRNSQIPFEKSLGSVMIHKFLELSSFIAFIFFSSVVVFVKYHASLSFQAQIAVAICLFVLLCIFAILLLVFIRKKRCFTALAKLMQHGRWGRRFYAKYYGKIKEMEDYILEAFYRDRRHCLLSLLVVLCYFLAVFLRPCVFFLFLDIPLHLSELSLIFSLLQLIQALQITPGGLGIVEGGIVGILSVLAIAPSDALGYATFCRVSELLLMVAGVSVISYYGMMGTLIPSRSKRLAT